MRYTTDISDDGQRTIHVVVKDKKGIEDPTTVAAIAVDDPTIASAKALDALGRTVLITGGKPGQTRVQVTCGDVNSEVIVNVHPSADAEVDLDIGPEEQQPPADASVASTPTTPAP